jgi:hypothetical protein
MNLAGLASCGSPSDFVIERKPFLSALIEFPDNRDDQDFTKGR